jgi:hypothetical protein
MTLSTRGYSLGENAWSYEAHFTAVVPGRVHHVREKLRSIGIPYFQRLVLERYGQHIPLEKIRGEFEAEEQALAPSPDIIVEPLEITYRGKMHHAKSLPTRRLPSDIVAYDPTRDSENDLENHDERSEDNGQGEGWEDEENSGYDERAEDDWDDSENSSGDNSESFEEDDEDY